ncbi:helix-turn-helix domain-containing protein [Escherichia coli]|uniref:helix-turn-helix domain-containing protein n=1 Tax=Enterobacteriaceae TaxID=543 RepID=UPI0009311879|nr:helix-turn-helix domain-containing protein [Klebsiella variicola]EFH2591121.1 helix-turn-helix domain-containing protein [Escherichia coli]EFH7737003.1 helix-turn-helix domain-containing protein [Escherichia coli]EFH9205862.1 AraC family transcriptional regulator [Escherichia coli]EJT5116068.1 helix-turn-helix domain-containing protein [Escherichia coli]ELE8665251.1 helix-turn-helix domain-containing protein [Escherichia coli]
MTQVCSIAFVKQSFSAEINNKIVCIRQNSLILFDQKVKSEISKNRERVIIIDIDLNTCMSFFTNTYNNAPLKCVTDECGLLIKENVLPSLTVTLFEFIEKTDHYAASSRVWLCMSLLSLFNKHNDVNSFIFTHMKSISYKVICIINAIPEKQWQLKDVSERIYMSESLIKKKLKNEGASFTLLLIDIRMRLAKKLLSSGLYSISETAIKCGYKNTSYFISSFKKYYGVTPSHHIKNTINNVNPTKVQYSNLGELY